MATAKTMTESVAQFTGHEAECKCPACVIASALWCDGYVAGHEALKRYWGADTPDTTERAAATPPAKDTKP